MLRRVLVFFISTLFLVLPAVAQPAPDYSIRNIRSRFADGDRQAVVEFEVWNIGGDATASATVTLNVVATGQQVATDIVPALTAQQIVTVSLSFPTSLFPANTVELFRASIGVGEVEPSGSSTAQDNFAQIRINFPLTSPEATPEPNATDSETVTTTEPKDIVTEFIESLQIQLDFANPAQVALVAGVCGAVIILLLLIAVILRAAFQRPPDFGAWQPPYANMPMLDPNTVSGRRQQWQLHAQNGSLPPLGQEGAYHIRKLPNGLDGKHLSGWRVVAIRLSQYDMYGRINRSQVIAQKRVINRLNAVARRSHKLTPEKLVRQLRPAAQQLIGQMRKKFNDRNVMLPLAMDVRLRGRHGDVRILFELYQQQRGTWTLVDQWEPEMAVIGKFIYEGYTYTLYGQRPGENAKSFRQRLVMDLAQTLAEFVSPAPPPINNPRPDQPTNPSLTRVP